MTKKRIVLSEEEYKKLSSVIKNLSDTHRLKEPHLKHLKNELEDALIMEESMLPKDRVTLRSKVTYTNLSDNSQYEATIVFPAEKDENLNRYSIFTPLGTALIGEMVNSTTICYAPGGEIPLQIEYIIQPNAL